MTIEEQERAAIMEFDGGLGRLEAERLARERPWDEDLTWGLPRAVQMELGACPPKPGEEREPDYIRQMRERRCGGKAR